MRSQRVILTAALCACVALASPFAATTALAAGSEVAAKPTSVTEALKLKYPNHQTKVASPRIGKKAAEAYELYSAEKVKEAIALLKDVDTDKDFDTAYIKRFLGNLLAAEDGKAQEAMKNLQIAVDLNALNPTDQAQSIRLLADLNMQEKNYDKAIAGYRQWMDYTSFEDKTVYTRMGQAYYELGKYEEIIPLADKAIKLSDKPDKNPYLLKLSSYYERKMYKDAVHVLEDVVKLFPEDPKWWSQLGMFYMLIEDYDNALATLEVAYVNGLLDKPNHFKGIAQLYYNANIPYKAAKVLEKHLKSGEIERTERMITMLANSYRMAKHFDKAAQYYGEAAKMENDGESYRKQASMYLILEKYNEAIDAASNALKSGLKQEGSVNMMIAEAYLYKKDLKNAHRYTLAAQQDPSTRSSAKGWASYIEDKAKRTGVKL